MMMTWMMVMIRATGMGSVSGQLVNGNGFDVLM
jgi:hypothetical protein